jgi:hypothetical protein
LQTPLVHVPELQSEFCPHATPVAHVFAHVGEHRLLLHRLDAQSEF